MILKSRVTYKHLLFLLFHISILFFLLVFSFITWENTTILNSWSKTIVFIAFLLLGVQLISFRYKGISITDYRFWFIGLSYIFMFGRVILNAFNLDSDIFWNLMARHSIQDLYHSSLFILAALQSIFIGFNLNDNKTNDKNYLSVSKEQVHNTMFKAGVILFFLSMPFRFYDDLILIIQTQSAGSYSALEGRTGIADDIAFLAVPSIIYIVASGRFNKRKVLATILTTLGYLSIIMILTGDRRYSVTAIIALILCYLKIYEEKVNIRSLIKLGILGILSLNLFIVIREIRADQLVSINEFFINYGQDLLFNRAIFTETLGEFGLTFFSVVNIFKIVPYEIPFQYGRTFLVSIPAILPIGWLFRDFFSMASLSGQVNPIAGASVGSSLIGDMYGNFYWFGLIGAIFAGDILRKVFQFNGSSNRINCAKYYSLFYILINLVRANFFEVLRPTIMVYVIPLLIIWLMDNKTLRKHQYNNEYHLGNLHYRKERE